VYAVKTREVIHSPARQHIHQHVHHGPDGHTQVTTTTHYEQPVIQETVHVTNPYPESKYYQRGTQSQHILPEDEIPGRRRYEKLPVDVRARDQQRIPSPGHRITYDPVFGLAGETVRRPPGNMEKWLKYHYTKDGGNLDDLKNDPFAFANKDPNEGLDFTPTPAPVDDTDGDQNIQTETEGEAEEEQEHVPTF
jgi:hypothetical protein